MAATCDVSIIVELLGLGRDQTFINKATDGTTPTVALYHYPTLASANSDEVLDLGDISTVTILAVRAVDYDLDVDLDYVTAFDADFTVKAGEPAAVVPNPAGVIRVKNTTTDETPNYEVLIIGTT